MAKFYKKGPLGRMVEAEGGASDPELAEVRMTPKEYKELWGEVRTAQKDAAYVRSEAEKKVSEIKKKAKETVDEYRKKAEADADRRVEEARNVVWEGEQKAENLRKRLEETNEIIKNEKHLNENLTRIMRERANQSRGIKPKKQHDGYLVLGSRQWKEKYNVEIWDTEDHMIRYGGNLGAARRKGYLRTEHKTADVWKSVLQTPYDASIPLEQVQYRVEEEDLWEKGILKDIGCTGMHESYANGRFNKNEKNGLYRWVFKANYRTRLWELEIYTTNELTVPEYRLPPQLAKPQKTRKTKEKDRKQPVPETIGMENTRGKEEVLEEDDDIFDDIFDDFESE